MKSGTSLLRVLLGQHPDLYATFESHWFEDALRFEWADGQSPRMTFLRKFLEIEDKDYCDLVEAKRAEPEREFIDIVFQSMLARENKRRWIDKTPDNVLHFDEIRTIWTDATLIHVTREPRDCFASWKDKRGDSLDTFLVAAKRLWNALGDRVGSRHHPGYLELDYVDLVANAHKTMGSLLADLGEDWDDAVAAINIDAMQRERQTVKRVTGRDSHTNRSLVRPIFSDSVGQWRNLLTREEAETIVTELAPYYARMGERWSPAC